jgi:hypothetical protein
MAIVTPSEFVLRYAPWSTSKADVAKQCPYKFYLQYVKKTASGAIPNTFARVGKAVHTAMELILRGAPVAQGFKIGIETQALVSDEIDTVKDMIPAAKKFISQYKGYCQQHGAIIPPHIEQKLGVDVNGNSVEFFNNAKCFLRGVVDLAVQFRGKNDILIIDHKTGAEKDIEKFSNQFAAYRLLLKAKYPTLESAYVGLNYLAADKVVLLPTPFSLKDPVVLMNEVVQFLNDATTDSHDLNVTRQGPLCDWCEYKNRHCPAFGNGTGNGEEE